MTRAEIEEARRNLAEAARDLGDTRRLLAAVGGDLRAVGDRARRLRWRFAVTWALLVLILGVVVQLLLRGRP